MGVGRGSETHFPMKSYFRHKQFVKSGGQLLSLYINTEGVFNLCPDSMLHGGLMYDVLTFRVGLYERKKLLTGVRCDHLQYIELLPMPQEMPM